MEKGAVFPLFYLPTIGYFRKLLEHKEHLIIENAEHFVKQSYRNRASIHSPNGKLDLIVPVIRGSKNHTSIKDVKISYDFDWQRLHLMSLQTSYRSSAYFEFYEDQLMPFYEKKWHYLFEFNEAILNVLLGFLKWKITYSYTNEFHVSDESVYDFRQCIHPKIDEKNNPVKYFQVFEERNGFLPNLSIVDLLFNQGPQSSKYI